MIIEGCRPVKPMPLYTTAAYQWDYKEVSGEGEGGPMVINVDQFGDQHVLAIRMLLTPLTGRHLIWFKLRPEHKLHDKLLVYNQKV